MGSNVPPMTPSRFPIERHPTAGLTALRSGAEPSFEVDDVLGVVEPRRLLEPSACIGRQDRKRAQRVARDHAGGLELRTSGGDIERPRQREPGAVQLVDGFLLGSVRPLAYPLELTGRLCQPPADVEHDLYP